MPNTKWFMTIIIFPIDFPIRNYALYKTPWHPNRWKLAFLMEGPIEIWWTFLRLITEMAGPFYCLKGSGSDIVHAAKLQGLAASCSFHSSWVAWDMRRKVTRPGWRGRSRGAHLRGIRGINANVTAHFAAYILGVSRYAVYNISANTVNCTVKIVMPYYSLP